MLGAIIGDLAAWTWENDHDQFYPQLISESAVLSDYGRTLLIAGNALLQNPQIPVEEYRKLFVFEGWGCERIKTVVRAIAVGWAFENEDDLQSAIHKYCLYDEKEELYAAHFMAKIIHALRHGATKKEAENADFIGTFQSFVQSNNWQLKSGILSTLIRTWGAFLQAFDYTSALHNTMKLPSDKRVNAIFTGAFAEAMYGCDMMFLKKKYKPEGNWYNYINIPDTIIAEHADIIQRIKQHKENCRVFFPKNRALINVECHTWTPSENPFKDVVIDQELRSRILKAFDTGWDDRYGFYLDNGWIYVYRSSVLLARFILSQHNDGTYRITHYQKPDGFKYHDLENIPMECALYSVMHRWDLVKSE